MPSRPSTGDSGRRKISSPLENAALRDSTMSQLARPLESVDLALARVSAGPHSPFERRHPTSRPNLPPSNSAPELTIVVNGGAPPRGHSSKSPKRSKGASTLKHRPIGPDTILDVAPRLPDAKELVGSTGRMSVASLLGHVDRRIEHDERAAQMEADRLAAPRPAPVCPPLSLPTVAPLRSASMPDVTTASVSEAAVIKHEVQQLLRSTALPPTPKRKKTAFARLFGGGRRKSEESDRDPRSSDESASHRPALSPQPPNRLRKPRHYKAETEHEHGFVERHVEPNWIAPNATPQFPLPNQRHMSAEAEDVLEVVVERPQLPEALRDFQWLAKTSLLVEDPSKLNIPGSASNPIIPPSRRRSLSAPAPAPIEVRQSVDHRQPSAYRYISPRERAQARQSVAQRRYPPQPIGSTAAAAPFMSMDDSPPPPRSRREGRSPLAPEPAQHVISAPQVPAPTSAPPVAPRPALPQGIPGRKLVSARTDRRIGVDPVDHRVPTWLRDMDGLDDNSRTPTPPNPPFARAPSTPTRNGSVTMPYDESPGTDLPASVRASSAGSDEAVDDRALFQLGTNLLKRTMSDASAVDPDMRPRFQQQPSFASAVTSSGILSPTTTESSSGADLDPSMTPELGRFASFDASPSISPIMPPSSITVARTHSGRRVPMPLNLDAPLTSRSAIVGPPRPPHSPDRNMHAPSLQQSPHDQARLVLERARTNRRRPKVEATMSGSDDESTTCSELTSNDHAHGGIDASYRPGDGTSDVYVVEELDQRSALTPMSFNSADVDVLTAAHATHAIAKQRFIQPVAPSRSPAPFSQLMPPFQPVARSRTPSPAFDGGRKPLRKPGEAPAMRARLVPPPGMR